MLLPALAVVVTSLNGGSYSTVARSICGAVVWALLLGLVILGKWPRRWPARETWVIGSALGVLVVLSALSMLWSDSAERSYLELNKLLLYLGVFALGALCAHHVADRRPFADGLTLGLAVVVVLAAVSRLEPDWFPAQDLHLLNPETAPRLSYPLNYWNAVGLLVAMAVPLLLWQCTRVDRPRVWRAAAAAVLPAAGLALFLTYSRGGLVATAAGAVTVLALLPARASAIRAAVVGALGAGALIAMVSRYPELSDGRLDAPAAAGQGHRVLAALMVAATVAFVLGLLEPERRWLGSRTSAALSARPVRVAVLVVLVAAVAAAGVAAVSQWDDFRSGGARLAQAGSTERFASASGNGRYQYWEAAFDAFKSRPIAGRGAGTWQFWWQRHATLDAPVRDSHSMLFDEMAELGILGLLAALATLGSVLWAGTRRLRRPSDRGAVAALLGACLAFVISAMIDWTWEIPALGMVFFAAAGLMAAREDPDASDRRPDRRFAAGVAVGVLGWVALVAQVMTLASSAKLAQSRADARSGDLAGAQVAANSAVSLGPWSASARRQLAQVLAARGELGAARDKAREAVLKEDMNWENWFVLARIESQLGDNDLAVKDLGTARSLNPRSTIWRDLGFGKSDGPAPAIADPDFVSDDEGSALVGGTPATEPVLQGSRSRIVETGRYAEFPQLRGLEPGARYAVRFAVRSLASTVPSGRVGDTSGGGWSVAFWTGRAEGWARIEAELTATAATERLTFLVDSGGPVAIDAIEVIRVQGPAP